MDPPCHHQGVSCYNLIRVGKAYLQLTQAHAQIETAVLSTAGRYHACSYMQYTNTANLSYELH